MHVHDMAPFANHKLDFTHTINKLSFGKAYPGMKNPLDGVSFKQVRLPLTAARWAAYWAALRPGCSRRPRCRTPPCALLRCI